MDKVKDLAKKLGLVETFVVNPVPEASGATNINGQPSQVFDYLIVIDFESTCWDSKGQQNNWQKLPEIIEFPAVLLNVKTGAIESEFHHYVMPIENPILSEFCRSLTGISQEQVNAGIPLGTCIMLFSQWVKKLSVEKKISFHKQSLGHKACTFVTWSDWDLTLCLQNETKRKQIRKPDVLSQWIDLRQCYKTFYQRKPQGLKGALSELGLSFTGREHSGIIDAKNTARLAHKMVKDGCQLLITSSSEGSSPQANYINASRHPRSSLVSANIMTRKSNEDSATPKTASLVKNIVKQKKSFLEGCNSSKEGIISAKRNKLNLCAGLGKKSPFAAPNIDCNLNTTDDVCTPKKQNVNLSNCKRTPPICRCGRRAVCKVANSPGPNQGRCFFTCPNQKRSLGMVSRTCSFFMWC